MTKKNTKKEKVEKRTGLPKGFRPAADTYYHLLEHFPEDRWETLSYRKQVCLTYLKWSLFFRNVPLRQRLVDLVKEWRLKEQNRFGGKRSLLERVVRKKLFKLRRREKLNEKNYDRLCSSVERQKKNKTGQFTEEMQAYRRSSANGYGKKTGGKPQDWIVYEPNGKVHEVRGLRAFCEERGLDWSHMSKTNLYPGKTYKGWKARKKNPFIDLSDFTK